MEMDVSASHKTVNEIRESVDTITFLASKAEKNVHPIVKAIILNLSNWNFFNLVFCHIDIVPIVCIICACNEKIIKGAHMSKTRMNISIDQDLAEYIKLYAQENRTTTSEVVTQFILGLKRRNQGDSMDIIYNDPDFHKAILDIKSRLQDGKAQWHTYDEVFAD